MYVFHDRVTAIAEGIVKTATEKYSLQVVSRHARNADERAQITEIKLTLSLESTIIETVFDYT